MFWPILFLRYINDLPLVINEPQFDLHGDDSSLYAAERDKSNIEYKLQTDKLSIPDWCRTNKTLKNLKHDNWNKKKTLKYIWSHH